MGANREMNDLDDRLRALDPFSGAPYEHADAASMVERITAGSAPRRRRRRLAVLVGPLAVASVAGLATVGALLSAGSPALQLSGISVAGSAGLLGTLGHASASRVEPLQLSYASPDAYASQSGYAGERFNVLGNSVQWSASTTAGAASSRTFLYALGTQLSGVAPSLDAYPTIPPADPEGVLMAGAARLGLVGTVTKPGTDTWRLGTEANPHDVRIAVMGRSTRAGLLTFRYQRGDLAQVPSRCARGERSGAVDTDRLAMTSTLAGLLRSLSVRYSLGSPAYSTTWSSAPHAPCGGTVLVTASVVVGGVTTDQSVQADFDPAGVVLGASVPVFTTGRSAAYPLVSPARAATSLVTGSFDTPLRPVGTPTTKRQDRGTAISRATYSTDLMVVELHAPTVGLDAFATTSGTTWLLPVYAFTGDGFAQHAARQTEWTGDVLAAAAPLVRVRGSHDNQANVFDLRELVESP
jgi:hypothetical protein